MPTQLRVASHKRANALGTPKVATNTGKHTFRVAHLPRLQRPCRANYSLRRAAGASEQAHGRPRGARIGLRRRWPPRCSGASQSSRAWRTRCGSRAPPHKSLRRCPRPAPRGSTRRKSPPGTCHVCSATPISRNCPLRLSWRWMRVPCPGAADASLCMRAPSVRATPHQASAGRRRHRELAQTVLA